ncbi:MAG: lipid-A-disaccharide synthase [Hyphomicrobiales bacterium]|nr:MAG: lipid-A-disaccharide synthase [Hyphomicrobiales bacterium]
MSGAAPERPTTVFFVVGDESGDQLGAALMRGLVAGSDRAFRFAGVGGDRMEAEGLTSLFPLHDIAVMGATAVIAKLPTILRRMRETVDAVLAEKPDILVIIDSPDFTHRVAKKVRKRRPDLPIVDYVSPSVWAWRPGRARKMKAYVDHLLAILPFEPDVHERLGGPVTTYVGHPLIERLDKLRPTADERPPLASASAPVLLVLPGSRRGELDRMLDIFGQAVELIVARFGKRLEVVIPAVPRLAETLRERTAKWPVAPQVVVGEEAKFAAFRRAHAALAASGTVTLELGLAHVPMVVAYVLDGIYRQINRLRRLFPNIAQVDTMVLTNIIIGAKAIPELLDLEVTPEALAERVLPLLGETPERSAQLAAFSRLDDAMTLEGGESPSARAARVVLAELDRAGR